MKNFTLLFFLLGCTPLFAQTDSVNTTQEEEDFSIYENATSADGKNITFCSPKIFDLSPSRFVSVAWDHQLPYNMKLSSQGKYDDGTTINNYNETAKANSTGGLRLFANIPVISSNKFLWQLGGNFWRTNYNIADVKSPANDSSLIPNISKNGLTTMGLHSTIFKPLNEKQFLLAQFAADLSGNYALDNPQGIRFLRYSASVLWGKRPSDRKQWAVGLSRTYRTGELNYVPIFLFNWTAPSRTWGTEILFPARAHVRKNFSARSLVLGGYELDGQSYRINGITTADGKELELRRGELRFRIEYQRQISGFIWGSIQAGYRHNFLFNADNTEKNGRDFFRGFFGTQQYAMVNELSGALYFNVGIHLVSP
jgi:hypothetical protein